MFSSLGVVSVLVLKKASNIVKLAADEMTQVHLIMLYSSYRYTEPHQKWNRRNSQKWNRRNSLGQSELQGHYYQGIRNCFEWYQQYTYDTPFKALKFKGAKRCTILIVTTFPWMENYLHIPWPCWFHSLEIQMNVPLVVIKIHSEESQKMKWKNINVDGQKPLAC